MYLLQSYIATGAPFYYCYSVPHIPMYICFGGMVAFLIHVLLYYIGTQLATGYRITPGMLLIEIT